MQPRISTPLLGLAYLVFALFLGSVMLEPRSVGLAPEIYGWQVIAHGITCAIDGLVAAFDAFGQGHPDLVGWITATSALFVLVPLLLGLRRSALWLAVTSSVALLLAANAVHRGLTGSRFSRAEHGGELFLVALAVLCAGLWYRAFEHRSLQHRWQGRPGLRIKAAGSLEHLPAPLVALVEETQAVRAALEIDRGLDVDTRRILWEWQRRVDQCPLPHADLLADLGLSAQPIKALTEDEGRRPPAHQLVAVDNALAHFETTLAGHQAEGYR